MFSKARCRFFALLVSGLLFGSTSCQVGPAEAPDDHGFNYLCTAKPKADPSCDEIPGVAAASAAVPLPERWAVGSVVHVNFSARANRGGSAVPIKVLSDSRDLLIPESSVDGGFRVLKAGSVALVALGPSKEVLGRARVAAHEIDHIGFDRFTPEGSQASSDLAITKVKIDRVNDRAIIRGVPMNAEGDVLAGDQPCKWTTSDERVVVIASSPNDNMVTVTATGGGSASLRLELGKIAVDLPVTVGP